MQTLERYHDTVQWYAECVCQNDAPSPCDGDVEVTAMSNHSLRTLSSVLIGACAVAATIIIWRKFRAEREDDVAMSNNAKRKAKWVAEKKARKAVCSIVLSLQSSVLSFISLRLSLALLIV